MRHLSVPRNQTQVWLERCKANGWLADTGVVALDEHLRAVPLNDAAPGADDERWEGHPQVEVAPNEQGAQHWRDHLSPELQALPASVWPKAYEIQGDVLLVKVEEHLHPHADAMAEAMLKHMPNVRIVCADNGVIGDYRVRDIHILASRDGSIETETSVREHDAVVRVDPAGVYFSARLSQQRRTTYERVLALKERLGRSVVIADPYAGVGPAFPLLLKHEGLVRGYLAGDLNPRAVELLTTNLERWTRNRTPPCSPSTVVCKDARSWKDDEHLRGQAQVVLVNLPHDSFEHLPDLFPLFDQRGLTLLRGWAIVERETLSGRREQLSDAVLNAGGVPSELHVSEVKGFSTTRCFVVFETLISWD